MVSYLFRQLAWFASALALGACVGTTSAPTPTSAPAPTLSPTAVPTVVPTATAQPQPTSAATTASAPEAIVDLAPQGRTVWNTTIGSGRSVGTCTRGAVLPVYGLVQVTRLDEARIEWKNQEPKPYLMQQIAPNTFRYSGPDSIDSGVVTLTVQFVDAQTLQIVREFTPKDDPLCTHLHEYGGVFQWAR